MKKSLWIIILIAVLAAVLLVTLKRPAAGSDREVLVICGGTMRAPIEAVLARYAKESPDRILATYGDSGEIMAQLQSTGKGDVFICHDPFMDWARQRKLVKEGATLGYLDNVIVVPKGNARGIRSVSDLAQPGLRLGVGDRVYSTSGIMVKQMLERMEDGMGVASNIIMETRGHGQRCTDVALGTLDAAIVWSAAARSFADKLDAVPIPADAVDAITSATYGKSDLRNVQVTMGLTFSGQDNPAARRFFEFATTRCKDIYEQFGFRLTPHREP